MILSFLHQSLIIVHHETVIDTILLQINKHYLPLEHVSSGMEPKIHFV